MSRQSSIPSYLVIIALFVGSLGLAIWLGGAGLDLYLNETGRDIESPGAFMSQSKNLESALLYWSFATLSLLVALVSMFVLGKSVIDDLSRKQRGSIEGQSLDELRGPTNPS